MSTADANEHTLPRTMQPTPPHTLQHTETRQRMEPDVQLGNHSGWSTGARCTEDDELKKTTFFIRPSDELRAAMHDELMSVSDPASAAYGQHKSKDEVDDMVAQPDSVLAVRTFLIEGGVDARLITSSANVVWVTGMSCRVAEQLLTTTIRRYTRHGRTLLRASSAYELPASIARHVALVAPLVRLPVDLPKGGGNSHGRSGSLPSLITNLTAPDKKHQEREGNYSAPAYLGHDWPNDCGLTCHGTSDTARAVTPQVLRQQYGLGDAPAHGALGSMAVASFQGEMWVPEGLRYYSSECGILQYAAEDENASARGKSRAMLPDVQIGVDDNDPSLCSSPQGIELGLCIEGMMDIELMRAVGGAVPLTVVYNDAYSLELLAVQLSELPDDEMPKVVSISYGDDEVQQDLDSPRGQSGAAYMEMVDLEFMKLGLRGATILVASGDQGVWGRTGVLGGDTFNADYPASSPYVTAVGGTDLKVANVLGDEQAWTDSGGGFSMHATQQSWQADAVNAYLDANETLQHLPPASMFNASGRAYPDVSALGGVQNPFCIVTLASDGWLGVGGTSASSPVFAGMVAKLNDLRLQGNQPVMGFINPFLYANPSAFRDVVYGENKEAGYVGFRATEGWDAATGLGTPKYEALAKAAMDVVDAARRRVVSGK